MTKNTFTGVFGFKMGWEKQSRFPLAEVESTSRKLPEGTLWIAGQETPPVSAMWERVCCRVRLRPLEDPEDWMMFVEAEKIPASRQVVSAFCHAHEGHPMKLAIELNKLRTWGGSA